MNEKILVKNANILRSGEIRNGSSMVIRDGKIESFDKRTETCAKEIDAKGLTLLPGIVDIHNDFIEVLIQPRKGTCFLNDASMTELITIFLSHGVTCFSVAISVSLEPGIRSIDSCKRIIQFVKSSLADSILKENVRIHLRYEITSNQTSLLEEFVKLGVVHIICLNDHAPQGISGWNREKYINNVKYRCQINIDEEEELIGRIGENRKQVPEDLKHIYDMATFHRIPLGVHDLSRTGQLHELEMNSLDFAEFPLSEEVVDFLIDKKISVVLGAPNVVMGRSQSGNIDAREIIRKGKCDALCSDYKISSLILAPYTMSSHCGMNFADAWEYISAKPARIFRIAGKGALAVGKDADFILVDDSRGYPLVKQTFVKGIKVYEYELSQ